MAGIKISDLPAATTPLAGTEQFALVQGSCTKVATVDDIGDVLSDTYTTLTTYASTSGVYTTVQSTSATWDSVYSSYQSTSADFAQICQNNIFAGRQTFNTVRGSYAQFGFCTTTCGAYASTIGGYYNDANGGGSAVAGGNNNDTSANFSFIGGGSNNSIACNGTQSFIGGGSSNSIACNTTQSFIGGGSSNSIACNGTNSFIGGGSNNNITCNGTNGAIIGGRCGQLKHTRSTIAGGTCVTSVSGDMLHAQSLFLKTLPTSDPGVAGVVWNDSGTLKISV